MALGSKDIQLLVQLAKEGQLKSHSAVIELGAQQLADSFLEAEVDLQELADLLGIVEPCPLKPPSTDKIVVHGKMQGLSQEAPRADQFWRWLKLSYASIDIDGSPGSIPLDLNYDDVPKAARGQYQLITNCGTTEHVANQLNAFKVIHDLAALGGVMIHNLPAQGMFNHGLINYNPKFFWMLARSNGYKLLHCSFNSDESYYSLPHNILTFMSSPEQEAVSKYRAADCAVVVALRKDYATPYVAPIDVPTGTKTDHKALEKRYWSVFRPDAFIEGQGPASHKRKLSDVIRRFRARP